MSLVWLRCTPLINYKSLFSHYLQDGGWGVEGTSREFSDKNNRTDRIHHSTAHPETFNPEYELEPNPAL